jgi:hypothetical protein
MQRKKKLVFENRYRHNRGKTEQVKTLQLVCARTRAAFEESGNDETK